MPEKKSNEPTPSTMPIQVGVFDTVSAAKRAVRDLQEHGFDHDQLTVFCSAGEQERQFDSRDLPPGTVNDPSGTAPTAAISSAIGGVLGGLTAVAGLATMGGLPILVAGGMAGAMTGGVVGGLAGAMASRGVEKEPADFFDQAVADGKILVSVEVHDADQEKLLAQAARILHDAGAEPISLEEG